MNIRQRHFIKGSEIKDLRDALHQSYDEEVIRNIIPPKSKVELIITEEDDELYAINNELCFWRSKEGYIPVLSLLLDNRVGLKTIVVDMGAVRFVTNGADVMRPGITHIDADIQKGDIVRIADEKNDRSLAVGKAMYDATEMEGKQSGKVIKNLHTIQDSVWEFAKTFT